MYDKLINRLENYKFNIAWDEVNDLHKTSSDGHVEIIFDVIKNLSILYGDCGWGIDGQVGKLVGDIVELIIFDLKGI